MRIIADFHIHSKYSRATSREMEVQTLARYAEVKGINLLATGDFTHPQYFAELQGSLEPLGNGLFKLRNQSSPVRFILTVEVSNIFSAKGKTRKIHTLIFSPSFEVAQKINSALEQRGKLSSDGRPIFGMHVKDLVKLVLDISTDCLLVPAHAWTPWFSVFGSESGFDSLEECFEEQAKNIYAIETGLSSDPAMNRRLSKLDRVTLISNSDSHSPSRIGREANVLDCAMDYHEIVEVIKKGDPGRFLYTIEFFPSEGKYHFDGHRNCNIVFEPKVTQEHDCTCPKCGKKLTIGVMHRVESLADRPAGQALSGKIPFKNMVPLDEIIADAFGKTLNSRAVQEEYERMIQGLGAEIDILLERSETDLKNHSHPRVLEGIIKVRNQEVELIPGYDGVYGKVKIFRSAEERSAIPSVSGQMELF
ncbi:MAG: endonuclease Q family protein [Candidatus Omnitrophica bacterium]|nr:endonuclease Q family protein [Candidatus Omnitrophota bacterium]